MSSQAEREAMNDVRIEGTVKLIGADQHPHASRRLRQEWPSVTWAERGSEPHRPSLVLSTSPDLPEGAFRSLSVRVMAFPRSTSPVVRFREPSMASKNSSNDWRRSTQRAFRSRRGRSRVFRV